jgi:hypothetical protein
VTDQLRALLTRLRRPGELLKAWREDRDGAALVQFIAILPVMALIIIGMWSMYQMYTVQQNLCEGVWQAARYLQVEGPYFDEGVAYPSGWIPYAVEIINTELRSNVLFNDLEVKPEDVTIMPQAMRTPPQEQAESRADKVPDVWFFVRAAVDVPNPIAFLLPDQGEEPGTLRIQCQKTAYYEVEPLRSTDISHSEKTPHPPGLPPTIGPPPTVLFVGPGSP